MGQRPLDSWTINRINQLAHDQHLKQGGIAKRLGILRSAVRKNTLPVDEWQKTKV